MTFSSLLKIRIIRTMQLLMPLFTLTMSLGTPHDPVFEGIWYTALCAVEWLGYNIVEAHLDETGLSYRRYDGIRRFSWSSIHSAIMWGAAGGVVIRLEGRSILRRYKFLLDSHPGINIVSNAASTNDSIEVVQLRQKLVGSIW